VFTLQCLSGKAGNYVSGPPPAYIFENKAIWEILKKYMVNAHIRFLEKNKQLFRIILWATTSMLSFTV